MKSADLIRKLEKAGWKLERIKGSHHTFKHKDHAFAITVPHPRKDLKKGLVTTIIKQAGL